jgi:hypothetical protein
MGRLFPLLCLCVAAALPAAGAERTCDGGICVTLAWPDRSEDLRTPAAVHELAARGELLPDEAEAALMLVERRLSLRIRGLELRYLIGKTATSSSDRTAIESIRYQVDAIDQEIAFLDQELGAVLEAYSRRTGPWLLLRELGGPAQVWFVAAAPCRPVGDVAIAADGNAPWIAAAATADPGLPLADLPGACMPWRLAVDGGMPWHGSGRVRLRVDAETWDFRFDG